VLAGAYVFLAIELVEHTLDRRPDGPRSSREDLFSWKSTIIRSVRTVCVSGRM